MTATIRKSLHWVALTLIAILALHLFVVIRSAEHLERARNHAANGHIIEAAREYQTAIGYHAPFSPYCDAATEELRTLAESTADTNPALAADLEDRLQRSVRGTRSWYQPPGLMKEKRRQGRIENQTLLRNKVRRNLNHHREINLYLFDSIVVNRQ